MKNNAILYSIQRNVMTNKLVLYVIIFILNLIILALFYAKF